MLRAGDYNISRRATAILEEAALETGVVDKPERWTVFFGPAGFGFRFGFDERTNARLDLGFPLSPGTNSRGQSPILYGQLETPF